LKNYAEKDLSTGNNFSSNALRECYRQAAERFGWAKRPAAPRSMRDGNNLIGWGMATGVWESWQLPAEARAGLTADGKLTVSCATADIGTGTYTIMTQIAAETMGIPISDVTFQLGDSSLPKAPLEGGSFTAATVGSAVKAVCEELRKKASSSRAGDSIEAHVSVKPDLAKQLRYARQPHTAVFAEVKVDEDLGSIEVSRVVSAVAAGRIINPKTARSQIMGGIVWGIGMALQEESVMDQNFGRFMNHNLAEYHVPVNADVHAIDVIFVEENDTIVNPLGVKGVGEPGIIGVAAAIGNAVFHATGCRVRRLPITLDKLLLSAAPGRKEREPAA
jgi:xanthine dehydrogenase YagR molybdenum-binding subunit